MLPSPRSCAAGGWRSAFSANPNLHSEEAEAIRKEARWRKYGVAFADRGPLERDAYRQAAQNHRKSIAVRRAWWPVQLAIFAALGLGVATTMEWVQKPGKRPGGPLSG